MRLARRLKLEATSGSAFLAGLKGVSQRKREEWLSRRSHGEDGS